MKNKDEIIKKIKELEAEKSEYKELLEKTKDEKLKYYDQCISEVSNQIKALYWVIDWI